MYGFSSVGIRRGRIPEERKARNDQQALPSTRSIPQIILQAPIKAICIFRKKSFTYFVRDSNGFLRKIEDLPGSSAIWER